jgi:hypothetical protein
MDQPGVPSTEGDPMSDPIITAAELADSYGLLPEDIRRLCPWAVEYGSVLDPYWFREDLVTLLGQDEGDDA